MNTFGYIKITYDVNDYLQQRQNIIDYAIKNDIEIFDFIESRVSVSKITTSKKIEKLIDILSPGDQIIIDSLEHLGKSLGQIMRILDILISSGIKIITIEENLIFDITKPNDLLSTYDFITILAETEKKLSKERNENVKKSAYERGKFLGRPKGTLGKSKLDGKENEIKNLLKKSIPKSSIAKIMDVSRTALIQFIKSRKLDN